MRSVFCGIFVVWCGSFMSFCRGEVFYQTGFEAENEPFGNYSVNSADISFVRGGGSGVSSQCAHRGRQSITPGLGNGRYGKSATKIFSAPFDRDPLWLEYWFRTEDDGPQGYKAFLYLFGNAEGKEPNTEPIATLMVCGNKIVANKKQPLPLELGTGWHQVRMKLKYATQACDLSVDGKLLPDIPFVGAKNGVTVRTLGKIFLGGGAAKDKLTFYDDLYIGAEEPPADTGSSGQPLFTFPDEGGLPLVAVNPAKSPPVIDGMLDDACWLNGSVLTPFLDGSGECGKQQQTLVYFTYDKTNVYIGFKCMEILLDPVLNQLHLVTANAKKRDAAVFKDDSVEIFLAPFPDSPDRFYQIAINCQGAIYDAALPAPGVSWNGAIEVGTFRNEQHWNLEIKIPLKDLQVAQVKKGDTWRANFCRNKSTPVEATAWSPPFGSFHNYQQFGRIKFADNALAIRSVTLPGALSDGANTIKMQIAAAEGAELSVQNKICYENADTVVGAVRRKIPGGANVNLADDFTVFTDTASRAGARNCGITYRVTEIGTGETYYASPPLRYSLRKYSPFRTSFIAHASGVYFHYFNELYIANNSSLFRNLLIQYAKNITGKFSKCELVMDLPEDVFLLRPGRTYPDKPLEAEWAADAIKQTVIVRNGQNRNSYRLNVPADLTYSMENLGGKDNRYARQIDLIFLCKTSKALPLSDTVNCYVQAEIDGQIIREPTAGFPLKILPEIKGKAPQTYPIISGFSNYNSLLTRLIGQADKIDACLGNIQRAGFNVFSVIGDHKAYGQEVIDTAKARGLKIEKGYFPGHYRNPAVGSLFPDATDYLKKYPQYKAVTGDGRQMDHVVNLPHLLDPTGGYRALAEKRLAEVARSCDIIVWDHELPVVGPLATGFSPDELADFKRYAGIKGEVSRTEVQSRYQRQWNDYQCRRNADRAILINQLLKKGNPNCRFSVYSGYQHDPPGYGTDWRLMAAAIDFAQCGYGRPLGALKETMQAIAPKPLIASEIICVNDGGLGYNFDTLRLNLFRRITDGNGGLMVFYTPIVDGRFWTAVGDISRLVSDFEPLFLNSTRNDSLVEPLSGFSMENVAVLKSTTDTRLIFLFNDNPGARTFKFKNLVPRPKARLRDYYAKEEFQNDDDVSVKVNGLDVKVLIYD